MCDGFCHEIFIAEDLQRLNQYENLKVYASLQIQLRNIYFLILSHAINILHSYIKSCIYIDSNESSKTSVDSVDARHTDRKSRAILDAASSFDYTNIKKIYG